MILEDGRCRECGGRPNRPGLYGCDEPGHPEPTRAQRVVWAILRTLDDRRGLNWDGVSIEVADELRDTLTHVAQKEMDK